MTEKLTDEERRALDRFQDQNIDAQWVGAKALEILDKAEARVRELEAEQDEALKRLQNQHAENKRLRDGHQMQSELFAETKARLAAVRELAERWTPFGVAGDCRRALLALLANQPAEPTRTEALDWTDKRCDHWVKVTRTEACVEYAKAGQRTEVEQAVLDAAIKAFRTGLRGPAYTLAEGEFEDALTAYETACRGLK